MIDHLSVAVSDYDKSKAFYRAALAPLGMDVVMVLEQSAVPDLPFPEICGIGEPQKPELWLAPKGDGPLRPFHIAFRAKDRAAVDAFYQAAIAAGGEDNGGPGLRPHYHPGYYGAFVLDPDGYNVEAVCHT